MTMIKNFNKHDEHAKSLYYNYIASNNNRVVFSHFPSDDLAYDFFSAVWEPNFKTDDGKDAKLKYYDFVTGQPDCETMQHRPIYYLGDTEDE